MEMVQAEKVKVNLTKAIESSETADFVHSFVVVVVVVVVIYFKRIVQ